MQTVQKVGVGGDLDAAATQLKRDELSLFDSRRQDRHLSERPYGSFWNEARWARKQTLPLTHCVTLVMIYNLSGPQLS